MPSGQWPLLQASLAAGMYRVATDGIVIFHHYRIYMIQWSTSAPRKDMK